MNPNIYENQKTRAISRKKELVELKGGKCCKCGYKGNYAALEFHHVIPSEKSFPLDARHLSNTSKSKILEEVDKCILVCSNCHKEIHYPEMSSEAMANQDSKKRPKSIFSKNKTSTCPVCHKEFPASRGKIYCSDECRKKEKGYPSKEEVERVYAETKSQQKTAEYFGLTRKIIIGILKR